MKRLSVYLDSLKSRYFMLFACLSLLLATTSCNNDELDPIAPEAQKQYTKAELIELALSRMPKTRGNDVRFSMITIKNPVIIQYSTTDDITIFTSDGQQRILPKEESSYNITFFDDDLSHVVQLKCSEQAIQRLSIGDNGLLSLNIYSNENLTALNCANNHLDKIDLKDCPNLYALDVSNNELTSLEITFLSKLFTLSASYNRLTNFQVIKEQKIEHLFLTNNQITELNLSEHPKLYQLEVANNPLRSLNLSNCRLLSMLDASFTQMTDLDLSNDINLWSIVLNSVPLKTINNQLIDSSSFSFCPALDELDIANTPFSKLDLSNNPDICFVNISGTSITQLDISTLHLLSLKATRSQLTNLEYGDHGLDDLYELRIESTPFEKISDNIVNLSDALPQRSEKNPGRLYTYSPFIYLLKIIKQYNWLINP